MIYWPVVKEIYYDSNVFCCFFLALVAMLFSQAEPSDQFRRWQNEDHFYEIILILDRRIMVQEISFEDISYLELWQNRISAEQNHLCNFGRGHHEKHFY